MQAEGQKKGSVGQGVAVGVFFGVGNLVLTRILEQFSDSSWMPYCSIAILLLVTYPIFFRGRVNIWTKDKRPWTFGLWALVMGITLVVLALIMFFIVEKIRGA